MRGAANNTATRQNLTGVPASLTTATDFPSLQTMTVNESRIGPGSGGRARRETQQPLQHATTALLGRHLSQPPDGRNIAARNIETVLSLVLGRLHDIPISSRNK